MKNIEKLINECIKMEQSVVNDVFKVDVFKCKKELEDYKQDQALQLQQTGVKQSVCKNCGKPFVMHSRASGMCPDIFKHFE